jgi:hypothetical protein
MESPLDPAVDDEILLDGQPDPLLAEWDRQHPLPAAAKAVDVSREPRDAHGRWTRLGGHPRPRRGVVEHVAPSISAAEARGDSRPVSENEFQRLAAAGRDELKAMMDNSTSPVGLDRDWDAITHRSYAVAQGSWGGATFDAHTGAEFTNRDNKFALSVKPPGIETVEVPEGATEEAFAAAMRRARQAFAGPLSMEGGALGVFHDDDLKRIDIDPVIVVGSQAKVETIGAYTHAIGGAYNFADGNGYFPPHVNPQAKAQNVPPPGPWPQVRGIARLASLRPRPRARVGQRPPREGGAVTTATARAKDVRAVHVLVELKALGDPEAEELADGLRRLIGTDDAELEARTEAAEAHVKARGYTESLHPRDNHGRWARHAGGGSPSGGAKPSGGAPAAGGGHRVRKDRVAGTYAVIRPDGSVAASGLRHSEAQIRSAELNHPHGKVPETVAALAAGKHTVCAPGELSDVVSEIKRGGKPVNLSNLHVAGADHGNLFDFSATDLPRESMPVIPDDAASVADFAAHLGKKGMRARIERGVDPSTLHATQNQLDGVKVAGIQEWAKSDPAGFAEHYLVATNDGAVLDGHHRWAAGAIASLNPPPSVKMNVLRVDTDIQTLLDAGWEFDAERGIAAKPFGAKAMEELGQEQPQGDPPDPSKPYLWFDGQWILLASDSADGVPRKLDVPGKQVVNTKLDSEPQD